MDSEINITLSSAAGDITEDIESLKQKVTIVTTDENFSEATNAMYLGINTLLFLREPSSKEQEILHKALLLDVLMNFPEQVFFPYALTSIKPPIFHKIESLDEKEISEAQPLLPFCYTKPYEKEEKSQTIESLAIESADTPSVNSLSVSAKASTEASLSIDSSTQSTSIASRNKSTSSAEVRSNNKAAKETTEVRATSRISLSSPVREYEYVEVLSNQTESLKTIQSDY